MNGLRQLRQLAAALGVSALLLIGGGVALAHVDGGDSDKPAKGVTVERGHEAPDSAQH
jgi:hypothetical protein